MARCTFKNYNGEACYAGYLIKAEPNEKLIYSDYLFEFTNSGVYDRWKSFIFNKATIENIGADKYSQLPVILPPQKEQLEIFDFIKNETKTINKITSLIKLENPDVGAMVFLLFMGESGLPVEPSGRSGNCQDEQTH